MDKDFIEYLKVILGKDHFDFNNDVIDINELCGKVKSQNEIASMCKGVEYFLNYITDTFNSGNPEDFINLIKKNPVLFLIFEYGYTEAEYKFKK